MTPRTLLAIGAIAAAVLAVASRDPGGASVRQMTAARAPRPSPPMPASAGKASGDAGTSGHRAIDNRAGTAIGLELEPPPAAPDLTTPRRSPAGRLVLPGSVDPDGYQLPLDIRWPRPAHRRPPRPSPTSITARRRAAQAARAAADFDEVRLGPDDGHTQNETTIDAEGDVLVLGWNNFTETGLDMGFASSTDGGETFVQGLLGGHSATSDPAVRGGGNGSWYYGYLARPGPGGSDYDIYVRRSIDGGQTWGAPVAASQNTSFDDKPYLDARGDEVLVAWADFAFSPAKVTVTRSIDGAQSFGPATVLAQNSVGGNGACPVIDPAGRYFVFWRDSFQDSLWVSRSTDQGQTWSPDRGIVAMHPLPTPQPGGYRMVNLPSAAAHPLTGELLVVWNDQRLGDPDILAIRSTDQGLSWSEPVRVNDDPGGETQFFPWVDFDPAGVAHVVWYDRRANGFDIDVYVASSTDGGASFGPNVRVTAQSFTPVLPWEGGAVSFIGDYNGIAATLDAVYPFYQDAREGNQDVWLARIPQATTGWAAGGEARPTTAAARLVASPSPFRTATRLRVSEEQAGGGDTVHGALSIDVYAIDGRLVRRLRLGAGNSVLWDGRDGTGAPAPAGVYLARLVGQTVRGTAAPAGPAGAAAATARLVKLD